jgi:tetratricopeptide (TPR) repeat protein
LLDALLGAGSGLKPLKERLIERTEGNPFFLEESVRTLVESGILSGEPGRYQLVQPLTSIQIPVTVQAILEARIDRLPSEEKRLLQSASVIGKDVPLLLLRAVCEMSESDLQRSLAHLQSSEFLYEMSLFPDIQYIFKHALTHQVAYASLLQERRRTLHAAMVEVIERLHAERRAEHVERLALHALRGGLWTKAVGYGRDAGAKALARSAHPEAVVSFEQALEALSHLPESREVLEQSIDLRFSLRNSLWPLGELTSLLKHLREAEAVAQALGDDRRLGQLAAYMSQFFAWMGEHDQAVEAGQRAHAIATSRGDFALRVTANLRVGQAYYALGEYRRGIDVLRTSIEELTGDRAGQRFGLTGLPSIHSRAWFIWCSAEIGDFGEARRRADEAVTIADAAAHPFDLVVASFGRGVLASREGRLPESIAVLERALELCRAGHVPFWIPLISAWLGSAYAGTGRVAEALPLLEQAVDQHAAIGLSGVHALFLALQGEGLLHAGRLDDADRVGALAVQMAANYKERGHEAWALRLLAEIATRREHPDVVAADAAYERAIVLATELGMRPLIAHCHLGLGKLYRRTDKREQAREHLAAATTMYREMGMTYWLEKTDVEVEELG